MSGGLRHVLTTSLDGELLLGRRLREYVEELPVPEGAVVVLDPQCPLVPAEFVAELVARVVETGRPHVGVRPVTDTVKVRRDGAMGETVDRDTLRALASPLVLPGAAASDGTMAELVAALDDVVLVEAPPLARRVADESEVSLLEALAAAAPQPARPRGT